MTTVNVVPSIARGYPRRVPIRDDEPGVASARPQSLMLTFLGIYVRGRDTAVYSGSVIEVFERIGISEEAVRSTLTRMATRDLLARHRRGRKVYLALTPRAVAVLEDGYRRIWETGAVNRDWNGSWTLVGFSLPDSRRSERHDLRSQLVWAGFGPLQNGLWIAAGEVDVVRIVEDLGLADAVTVLTAQATKPTESADLVGKAFDLPTIAARYQAFLSRWDVTAPAVEARDDLARQLLLHTDWLQLVRQDPHLPAEHLPAGWPAVRAEKVFRTLAARYDPAAAGIAAGLLDEIALPPAAAGS
ncbi:PaaX family transcriptional regulator C-terminal domain-containing protein [Pseudonocardia xinjiangensis]